MATCDAELVVGDDYGDNEVTFRCQLPDVHSANHEEITVWENGMVFVVQWMKLDSLKDAQQAAEELRNVARLLP